MQRSKHGDLCMFPAEQTGLYGDMQMNMPGGLVGKFNGKGAAILTGALTAGELYETSFDTSAGQLGLRAEVEINGSSLHLKDESVYPKGADRLDGIGRGELKGLAVELSVRARAAVFTELRITGNGIGGPMDGHRVDLTFSLGGS